MGTDTYEPGTFLTGVRVVDCTEFLAGPYCSWVLACLGAEVIKVERPGGDSVRRRTLGNAPESVPFHMVQSNKRSIIVDLSKPEGCEVLRAVTLGCDVFLENFRSGVMDRLGLGAAALRAAKPELIYASIRGFSPRSEYKDLGGVDLIAQAMGGLLSVTGPAGVDEPSKAGYPVGDMGAGMWAAIGILAAYARRLRTGVGAEITSSLLDTIIGWSMWDLSYVMMTGEDPGHRGSAHLYLSPFECYKCGDSRFIAIGVGNNHHWLKLCQILGIPELVRDPRFEDLYERGRRADEVRAVLSPILLMKSVDDWIEELRAVGIPCGPVMTTVELLRSSYLRDAGMLSKVERQAGNMEILNLPLHSEDGLAVRSGGPDLGADTIDVLSKAGFSEEQIQGLVRSAVVGIPGASLGSGDRRNAKVSP